MAGREQSDVTANSSSISIGADYEKLNKAQRLKAALYHSMTQIAKEVEDEMDVSINSQVTASLSECLNRQVEIYATDVELFARHAKRSVINVDDVKLLVRKNPVLLKHIEDLARDIVVEKDATKKPRKTKKGETSLE